MLKAIDVASERMLTVIEIISGSPTLLILRCLFLALVDHILDSPIVSPSADWMRLVWSGQKVLNHLKIVGWSQRFAE